MILAFWGLLIKVLHCHISFQSKYIVLMSVVLTVNLISRNFLSSLLYGSLQPKYIGWIHFCYNIMRLYLHYLKPVFSRTESVVYIFYEALSVMALGVIHSWAVTADCGGVAVASHSSGTYDILCKYLVGLCLVLCWQACCGDLTGSNAWKHNPVIEIL
jgi:hypothetical protein